MSVIIGAIVGAVRLFIVRTASKIIGLGDKEDDA